ncbi:MAG: hypothetical protein AAFO15_01910 [Pseudomonadota bacterium]
MSNQGYVIYKKEMLNHYFLIILTQDDIVRINCSINCEVYIGDLISIEQSKGFLTSINKYNNCFMFIDKILYYLPILSIAHIVFLHIESIKQDNILSKIYAYLNLFIQVVEDYNNSNDFKYIHFNYVKIKKNILLDLGYSFFIKDKCLLHSSYICPIKYVDFANMYVSCRFVDAKTLFKINSKINLINKVQFVPIDNDLLNIFNNRDFHIINFNKYLFIQCMYIFNTIINDHLADDLISIVNNFDTYSN